MARLVIPRATRLVVAHTGQLGAAELAAARQLLEEVSADELTDADWDHCLGGLHALMWQGCSLVGHAALVQRRLLHRGRAWRTGYVEGVAVRAPVRCRGQRGDADVGARAAGRRCVRGRRTRGDRRGGGLLRRPRLAAVAWPDLGADPGRDRPHAGRRRAVHVLPLGPRRLPLGLRRAGGAASATDGLDLDGELVRDWRDGDLW